MRRVLGLTQNSKLKNLEVDLYARTTCMPQFTVLLFAEYWQSQTTQTSKMIEYQVLFRFSKCRSLGSVLQTPNTPLIAQTLDISVLDASISDNSSPLYILIFSMYLTLLLWSPGIATSVKNFFSTTVISSQVNSKMRTVWRLKPYKNLTWPFTIAFFCLGGGKFMFRIFTLLTQAPM